MASTSASSWSSAISRLRYPYCSARGPSRSSATRRILSARPRPTRRDSLAIGPPPGTTPTPTSHWPRSVFSREANRRSQASTNSLPAPRARPRIEAMLTTGTRARRTRTSIQADSPVGPTRVPQSCGGRSPSHNGPGKKGQPALALAIAADSSFELQWRRTVQISNSSFSAHHTAGLAVSRSYAVLFLPVACLVVLIEQVPAKVPCEVPPYGVNVVGVVLRVV